MVRTADRLDIVARRPSPRRQHPARSTYPLHRPSPPVPMPTEEADRAFERWCDTAAEQCEADDDKADVSKADDINADDINNNSGSEDLVVVA